MTKTVKTGTESEWEAGRRENTAAWAPACPELTRPPTTSRLPSKILHCWPTSLSSGLWFLCQGSIWCPVQEVTLHVCKQVCRLSRNTSHRPERSAELWHFRIRVVEVQSTHFSAEWERWLYFWCQWYYLWVYWNWHNEVLKLKQRDLLSIFFVRKVIPCRSLTE